MIAPMNLLKVWAVIGIWSVAQLASGGLIAGTIRLSGGRPAAGIRVAAMVVPGVGRPATDSSEYARITQTDSIGRYQLENLPPGRYFILAGPVSAPTFHPGTFERTAASIVAVTKGGMALTGIDFAVEAEVGNPAYGFVPVLAPVGGCCRFSGQLVTEDGSRFPDVPMKTGILGGAMNSVYEGSKGGLAFALSAPIGGTVQFAMEGLPPGYFLKSVELGGRKVGVGPVFIDGKSLATLVFTAGYLPVSTLQKVTARGKVVNIAREVSIATLSLTSTNPSGPTVVSGLGPDGSFEFANIPIGVYRPSLFRNLLVIPDTVSNLTIDLRNNPFPETDPQSLFTGGKKTMITGVVTEKLTYNGNGYFRMSVKNESTGAVTPWGIYVAQDWLVPKIVVGDTLSVPGTLCTDGTNRLSADAF